jgi:hypothetical protein
VTSWSSFRVRICPLLVYNLKRKKFMESCTAVLMKASADSSKLLFWQICKMQTRYATNSSINRGAAAFLL